MKINEKMTIDELVKFIVKNCPNSIILDGLDDCIVAVHIGMPNRTNVIYSKKKIVNVLMNRDGMSFQDAVEFFDYNIAGLKFDQSITPYFVDDITMSFQISLN